MTTYDLIHQQVNKHINNTTIPDIATKAQGFTAVKKGDVLFSAKAKQFYKCSRRKKPISLNRIVSRTDNTTAKIIKTNKRNSTKTGRNSGVV
jgi:hypothetical protein